MADTTIDSGMGMFGFLILALLFLGNGGGFGWGGNGNNNAIQNDINRGFDSQNTMAQTRDILSAVTNGTAQTISASTQNAQNAINAIKDGNAGIIREFGNVETAISALSGKQSECCCNTLRAIDANTYAGAINTADINKTTVEQTQKILDALAANKIQSLESQVSQLQLANAMSGVVRYPQAITYGAGPSPFCGCGYNYAL